MLKNSEFYETLVEGIGEGIKKPKPNADFNENDPKNPGYIKNRTHWKEKIPEKNVVICGGTQPSGSTSAVDAWALSEHLVAGATYKMTVNGYIYSAVATTIPSGVALSLKKDSDNTVGSLYETNQSGKLSFSGSPSGSKEFKIELNDPARTVYHPIDANYLPQNRTTYTVVINENPDTGELELSKDTPWEDLVKAYEDGCHLVLVDARASQEHLVFYNFLYFNPNMETGLFVFERADIGGQDFYFARGVIANMVIAKTTGGVVQVWLDEITNLITSDELSGRVEVIDTSGGNYHCSPDFDTIYDWCSMGKNVYCYCNGQGYEILPLYSYSFNNIVFRRADSYYYGIDERTVTIKSDGGVDVKTKFVPFLAGITDATGTIRKGQTIVAEDVPSGGSSAGPVRSWKAADIVSPSAVGNLSDLTTESKENLVAAINEVKASGGGGASVQSDWNQNDESAADYVKNRTHWLEATVVWDIPRFYYSNSTVLLDPPAVPIIAGQTYRVTRINSSGSSFTSNQIAEQIGESIYIEVEDYANHVVGRISILNQTYKYSGMPNQGFALKITLPPTYHPLDENYLPDSVKNYYVKIVQDDDGNITSDKTPDEISAAYEAGCAVYAKYRDIDRYGILSLSATGITTIFTGTVSVFGSPLRALVMYVNGSWSAQFSALGNVVTELSDTSTDYEVPSAKCVYDTMNQGLQCAIPIVQQLGINGAQAGQLAKIKAVDNNGNPTSWEAVDMPSSTDLSLGLTSASVGQIIKVKAVDEEGKPTEWETAEEKTLKWVIVHTSTLTENINKIAINADENGKPIADYRPLGISLVVSTPADSTQTDTNGQVWAYPQNSISDNVVRIISTISSWKTIARDSIWMWQGGGAALAFNGNNNGAASIYGLDDFVINGVCAYIQDTNNHFPAGTKVAVSVLTEM